MVFQCYHHSAIIQQNNAVTHSNTAADV